MSTENIYQAPKSDLENTENEELKFAGFWIRVLASIVDTILLALITVPVLMVIYGAGYWESDSFIQGYWDVLISYVFPAIVVIIFWLTKSATPGKMMLGLKVISLGDSTELSTGQAIGRYLGYYVASLILLIGIIWVAFDKRKQGWHDKLANTAVVKK